MLKTFISEYSINSIFLSLIVGSLLADRIDASNMTVVPVTCGLDIELQCPIQSTNNSDELISWFRSNKTSFRPRFSLIAIGALLLPEFAALNRFQLLSSHQSKSRLIIGPVHNEDQGFYRCKSTSHGHHTINLNVRIEPHLSPESPLLLDPINRTFSITCSLPCQSSVDLNELVWLKNGLDLNKTEEIYQFERADWNRQRLIVTLKEDFLSSFTANYTCRYKNFESSMIVRRQTKEELHRSPRQQTTSSSSSFKINPGKNDGQRISSKIPVTFFFVLFHWSIELF